MKTLQEVKEQFLFEVGCESMEQAADVLGIHGVIHAISHHYAKEAGKQALKNAEESANQAAIKERSARALPGKMLQAITLSTNMPKLI